MKLFGIELRRPSFNEITAATVLAVGLWIAAVGIARVTGHELLGAEAGALLVVAIWGCIAVRIGLALDKSRRHLVANIAISALLLGVYQGAMALAM
jgi:hypothetical protein